MSRVGIIGLDSERNKYGHFVTLSNQIVESFLGAGCTIKVFNDIDGSANNPNDTFLNQLREIQDYDIVFHEWLHDWSPEKINLLAKFLADNKVRWYAVGSLSRYIYAARKNGWAYFENLRFAAQVRVLSDFKNFGGLLIFDHQIIAELLAEGFKVKFLGSLKFQTPSLICDNTCSELSVQIPAIGVLGNLFGYRGVNRLLETHSCTDSSVILAGQLHENSLSFAAKELLTKKSCRDIWMKNEYFNLESDLFHYLTHIEALYVDTLNYAEPSGVSLVALEYGLPVIIEEGDSYLYRLIPKNSHIYLSELIGQGRAAIGRKIELSRDLMNFRDEIDCLPTLCQSIKSLLDES